MQNIVLTFNVIFTSFLLGQLFRGVSGVVSDEVSEFVKEGDSVTLNPGVELNQEDKTVWYHHGNRLAQISGNQTKICTDVECKDRFEGRLKVDRQTGSLTITNCKTDDSGVYERVIIGSDASFNKKTFRVNVHGFAAGQVEKKRVSVKEGEPVTLGSGEIKNQIDSLKWHFNKTLIAQITGDQSQICTVNECKERFRDRLKVDHETGSLTITNTRTTDSGEYQLQIFSISGSRRRRRRSVNMSVMSFGVDVTAAGLSLAAVVGCVSGALSFLLVALGLIYYCKTIRHHHHHHHQNGAGTEMQTLNDQVSSPPLKSSTETNSQPDKCLNLDSCDMAGHQSWNATEEIS